MSKKPVIRGAASAWRDTDGKEILVSGLSEPQHSVCFLSKRRALAWASSSVASARLVCAGLGFYHQGWPSLKFIFVANCSLVLSGEPGEASSFPSMGYSQASGSYLPDGHLTHEFWTPPKQRSVSVLIPAAETAERVLLPKMFWNCWVPRGSRPDPFSLPFALVHAPHLSMKFLLSRLTQVLFCCLHCQMTPPNTVTFFFFNKDVYCCCY